MLPVYPASLRLGTRGSELARWQARHVAARLATLDVVCEIVIIQTRGDLDQRTTFGQMGGKGIFVKEIEEALLARRIDLAVHSLKDLPTDLAPGLALAAVLERDSPFDALFSRDGQTLAELPAGARLASGSLRRAAQVLALRPDLTIAPLRGNVPTRVEKIKRGEADATLLAVAGLRRLGLESVITQTFSVYELTPPMGQGILGIETRADEWPELWRALDDPGARRAAEAERAWLAAVGGGCRTPAGVLAEVGPSGVWRLTALLASPDGRHLLRQGIDLRAPANDAAAALRLARAMLAEAHPAILETLAPPLPGEFS